MLLPITFKTSATSTSHGLQESKDSDILTREAYLASYDCFRSLEALGLLGLTQTELLEEEPDFASEYLEISSSEGIVLWVS